MAYTRIPTVTEACELHPDALDFALSDQVEHLGDLLTEAEDAAEEFFEKNHVTHGMETLLREALHRLDGRSAQALFELRQAMGGGKTHSMLALGLLARNPHLFDRVPPSITKGISRTPARVVAINGRSVSRDHFVWGDIAEQLGKLDAFDAFWRKGPEAPRENEWMSLIGDEPTLILLDELPPYFDYARTHAVGAGTLANITTFALANLFSAAMKLPRTAIVISSLVGSYQGASKELEKVIRNLSEEAKRQARPITPVDLSTNEIYAILRKRMFTRLPDEDQIGKVAEAFGQEIDTASRAKTISRSAEQIADEIMGSYPFHPSVKSLITLFRENENYRQTRGLMQFVSKMLLSVWEGSRTGDVYLIGCQHLDLSIASVRDEINRIGNLDGAVSRDIEANDGSAHAQVIDANSGNNAASQAATLLLTASLSQSVDAVKGLNRNDLIQYLIAPDRSATEYGEAFDGLQRECWYLHRKENDAWYFSKDENLRKLIQSTAANAPAGKVEEEMRRRLAGVFAPSRKNAYDTIHALPRIDDVQIKTVGRCCLVMSPDSNTPPEDAKKFLDVQTYKNGFCVVAGDGSSMGNLEDRVREVWAIAKVQATHGANSQHREHLEELAESAEFAVNSALSNLFNRVYYPAPTSDKRGAQLSYAPLKLGIGGKGIEGEAAVEEALSAIGSKKLVLDVAEQIDALMQRAEDMLWPDTQSRTPWKDILLRAQSNPRWPWLPPKGMDDIRAHALSIGRWSDAGDGFVDKNPPKARATVNIVELSYDAQTGAATVEVHAQNAGRTPEILVSATGDFAADATPLERNPFTTHATRLWFQVSDPLGDHPPADPVVWRNKLTLTHDPRFIAGERVVSLSVVPLGEIRWNIDGSNPKEGRVYDGPITLTGREAVTIYAYASDGDVAVRKEFIVPGREDEWELKPNHPATLVKGIMGDGVARTFEILKAATDNGGKVNEVAISVGSGARNIRVRTGTDTEATPTSLEAFIKSARQVLGDEACEVQTIFKSLSFQKGFDLQQFVRAVGEEVGREDVIQ